LGLVDLSEWRRRDHRKAFFAGGRGQTVIERDDLDDDCRRSAAMKAAAS